MKLLTFSGLYPSSARPTFGIFVEQRLRQLVGSGRVQAKVIAPVPWFPFRGKAFADYSAFARTPRKEVRHGIEIEHPRFLVVPKIGMSIAPFLLGAAMVPVVRKTLQSGFAFDILDAHYFYPDGVAAVHLGRKFGKPTVITARGSDINLLTRFRVPRRKILWAARNAAAIVTVSDALRKKLLSLGVDGRRITVLRNGVDLDRFRPVDSKPVDWPWDDRRPTILSVGNLVEGKGHHVVVDAVARIRDVRLVIAGDGGMRGELTRQIDRLDVAARVFMAGAVSPDALRGYYSAADMLVLASRREGMPNVVLEAMACGCPVLATRVGGVPEVVREPTCGMLIDELSAAAVARGIEEMLERSRDRDEIRRYAGQLGWGETVSSQIDLYSKVLDRHRLAEAFDD